jgi:hypothetical protein
MRIRWDLISVSNTFFTSREEYNGAREDRCGFGFQHFSQPSFHSFYFLSRRLLFLFIFVMNFAYTAPFPNPSATPILIWKPRQENQRLSLEPQQSLRRFDHASNPYFISEILHPIHTPRQNVQLRPLLYLSS